MSPSPQPATAALWPKKLPPKRLRIVVPLEANHCHSRLRVKEHKRGCVAANPHRDPLLGRFLVVRYELSASFSAAALKKCFNPSVPGACHAKVDSVKRCGVIQPMILLVPTAWSALDNLD